MGLSGLAIAVLRAEKILGLPACAGQILTWFSAGMFLLLAIVYASKLLRFREEVAKELSYLMKLSFFPALSIASMLMYSKTGIPFFQGVSWLLLAILAAIIAVLAVRTLQAVMRGEICVEE